MTLATNLICSASFRCEIFFKIALGTMLLCCRVKICWENTLLKHQTVRSNHQGVQSVLKNFTNFPRKNLCWSLFLINPEGLQLYPKEIQHRCFPVKFAIFLKTPKFLKLQQHNLFISYWMDLVLPSTPIIHVINLLLNNVTCIYFSVSFYTTGFIDNTIREKKQVACINHMHLHLPIWGIPRLTFSSKLNKLIYWNLVDCRWCWCWFEGLALGLILWEDFLEEENSVQHPER